MRAGTGLKFCPFCKEEIREDAVKCRFCGEWFEERALRATGPQTDAESTASGGANTGAGVVGSANLARRAADAASSNPMAKTPNAAAEPVGKGPSQSGYWQDYWYGYVYMAFWGCATLSAASHLLLTVTNPPPLGDVVAESMYWTGLVVWTGATALFAHVTYRLSQRQVKMRFIYDLVVVHGISVLARGIRPIEFLFWLFLSWLVVTKFTEQKRLEAGLGTEDLGYELLERATRLETKGRIQEALAAYHEIAEIYSHTHAGLDAQKSLESLQSKVGKEIR